MTYGFDPHVDKCCVEMIGGREECRWFISKENSSAFNACLKVRASAGWTSAPCVVWCGVVWCGVYVYVCVWCVHVCV